MSKKYSPFEVAVIVLKKAEELTKSAMAGLTPTKLTPVPGVISPKNSNTGSPMKVGSQAVVKAPKAKKMGQALVKPSVFFKSEEFQGVKKPSIGALRAFLEKQRSKR
jgi:hypothetical protein